MSVRLALCAVVCAAVMSAAAAQCDLQTTCSSCISQSSCGWCDGSCVSGDSFGSNNGLCSGSSWSWTSCSTDPCNAYTTCGSCTTAYCGWCSSTSTCKSGSSGGPDSGYCSDWDWLMDECAGLDNDDDYVWTDSGYGFWLLYICLPLFILSICLRMCIIYRRRRYVVRRAPAARVITNTNVVTAAPVAMPYQQMPPPGAYQPAYAAAAPAPYAAAGKPGAPYQQVPPAYSYAAAPGAYSQVPPS